MSDVFLLRDDVPLDALLRGAQREGWPLRRRVPRRGSHAPYWEWATGSGEEDRAVLVDHPTFGVRYLRWLGQGALPGWLEGAVTRASAEASVASARDAEGPEDKIARLCEALACFAPAVPEGLREVLAARLLDGEGAVRWMAYAGLPALDEASLDAVLGALLAKSDIPADIEGPARHLHGLIQASIRGEYVADLENKDADSLRHALGTALAEKKWRRVEVAAAKLLWAGKPLRELTAAAAWAAAMAAADRPWKAWIAALVVAELDRIESREGRGAVVRTEVEPRLAGREDGPALEDLHPLLWLLRDRSDDGWGDALDRALDALDARVTTLEAERLLMRVIADSGAGRTAAAREKSKRLGALRPGSITPVTLLAFFHSWDDASDEALADYERLADAVERRERVAKGEAEPPSPEEAAFDAWAEGILAYQARKPDDLLRNPIRAQQQHGDKEGALRAAERALRTADSALAGAQDAGEVEGAPAWERDPFGNPYIDRELNRRLGLDSSDEDHDSDDEDYDSDDDDSDDDDDGDMDDDDDGDTDDDSDVDDDE